MLTGSTLALAGEMWPRHEERFGKQGSSDGESWNEDGAGDSETSSPGFSVSWSAVLRSDL